MPRKNRRQHKSPSAERRLIAFLKSTKPDNVRFGVPDDGPPEWGVILMRDPENSRATVNIESGLQAGPGGR